MWKKRITVEKPYDFKRAMQRLSLDPLNEVDIDQQLVSIPIYATKKPTVAYIKSVGQIDDPKFVISSKNEDDQQLILDEVVRIFQFDQSLGKVNRHFSKTNLKSLFEEHAGTPLVLEFSVYSSLIKCMIHQQLNLKFAHTLTERFVHTFGSQIDGVWFYPTPEQVADLSYQELRDLQFSQRKAEYIIDTSRLIVEGTLNVSDLNDMSDEEVKKRLIKVRGIGPWTVQNMLMNGLGRQNLFPKTDIGIQNAIKQYFELESKPSMEQIEKYSEKWSPYSSYAALYLWRSIEPN